VQARFALIVKPAGEVLLVEVVFVTLEVQNQTLKRGTAVLASFDTG
jgi:hypothetical protein